MEVLKTGYRVPFSSPPPLSPVPIPLPSYSPTSIKGIALQGEILALIAKGAVELAPLSPEFYSRLFVVQKALGQATFRSSPDGSDSRGIFRQCHCTGLHSEAGRHIVTCFELRGPTSAALDRVSGDHHSSLIYHGIPECGG